MGSGAKKLRRKMKKEANYLEISGMENIENKKFPTRELAIQTLNDWAKVHGKKPTQEELEECIDVHWEEDGKWMVSNMDELKDNPPVGAYYGITNFLEDINE